MLGAADVLWLLLTPSPLQLGLNCRCHDSADFNEGKRTCGVPFRAQWATLPWNVHDFQPSSPLLPGKPSCSIGGLNLACCVAGAGLGVGWFMRGLEWMGSHIALAEEVQCREG